MYLELQNASINRMNKFFYCTQELTKRECAISYKLGSFIVSLCIKLIRLLEDQLILHSNCQSLGCNRFI